MKLRPYGATQIGLLLLLLSLFRLVYHTERPPLALSRTMADAACCHQNWTLSAMNWTVCDGRQLVYHTDRPPLSLLQSASTTMADAACCLPKWTVSAISSTVVGRTKLTIPATVDGCFITPIVHRWHCRGRWRTQGVFNKSGRLAQ